MFAHMQVCVSIKLLIRFLSLISYISNLMLNYNLITKHQKHLSHWFWPVIQFKCKSNTSPLSTPPITSFSVKLFWPGKNKKKNWMYNALKLKAPVNES